ncbi:unnamed protein product [Allacma fusca]|uniref:BHLH domain-containing protein n=1 Tax=Allacma fusca TaxID=39272 RepID=A0A8J2PYB0_9HEXA|nr:unnamed protein product [Allacma fusca]
MSSHLRFYPGKCKHGKESMIGIGELVVPYGRKALRTLLMLKMGSRREFSVSQGGDLPFRSYWITCDLPSGSARKKLGVMPRKKKSSSENHRLASVSSVSINKDKPIQRNAANARERARMRVLSRAFCRLKTTLPWVPADTKLSKLDTLRLAASYIAHLKGILREDHFSTDDSVHPAMNLCEICSPFLTPLDKGRLPRNSSRHGLPSISRTESHPTKGLRGMEHGNAFSLRDCQLMSISTMNACWEPRISNHKANWNYMDPRTYSP